jgi:hypothetical protein
MGGRCKRELILPVRPGYFGFSDSLMILLISSEWVKISTWFLIVWVGEVFE